MKVNKFKLFGISFLVITLCVLFVVSLRVLNRLTMPEQLKQREQLKMITSDLQLDMTRTQVLGVLRKHEWTSFNEMEDEIGLVTKPQPLPTNWMVRLFFKDDRLTTIKYCNADNISKRPEDAPPDITE